MKNGINHEKRLGEFLVQMMNQNRICFTLYEYAQHYDLTLAGLMLDLYHGLDIGILDHKVAFCRTVYYISTEPIPTIRVKGLTDEMKRVLTHIYQEYGQNDFLSTVILGKITERKWLHRLIDRGIMYRERRGAQYYSRLLISPQSHPECFVSSDSMAKHKPHYT